MTELMVEIAGVWLLAVLAGLPLFASMGLAAFAFVHLAGLKDSIVPQKMAQAMNSFPLIAAPLFILMGVSLMVMVAFVARREGFERSKFGGLSAIGKSFIDGFWALMAPVVLLGGMFSGIFTPTEAAAAATLYALFLGFVVYRTLTLADMPRILIESVETTGLVTALVMVAGALGWCMSVSRLPQAVTPLLTGTFHGPIPFLLMCNLVLLLVGCFMETLAALLLLIPILVPAAHSFGIDPVQFGLIMIFNLILGTIHPPVGVVLFVTSRIAGISYEAMSRAILPWLTPLLAVLLLITIFPPLTTFLPNLLMP